MIFPAAFFVAVAVVAALSGASGAASPLFLTHAFFAAAALPLMFGAILHFVPVLTRSGPPAPTLARLPALAAAAGLVVLATFADLLPRHAMLAAALVDAAAALAIALWIVGRLRRAIGSPHPGTRWYPTALAMLLLGLSGVFGMLLDGGHYGVWRKFHQHANLFGWIALTALGTLPVLLPTAIGGADPAAAPRLRRDLPAAAGAALLLTLAAAFGWSWLAAAAALVLAAVAGRNLLAWWRTFGRARLGQGVPAGLALATAFLTLLLGVGAVHGFGLLPTARLVPAFVFGFLLTLVTAALAQLLPVWRLAGPQTPLRTAFAAGLAAQARARAMLFVGAGLLALAGVEQGAWLAAAGLAAFVVALLSHWPSGRS